MKKRNKVIYITCGIAGIIALILFIVGGYLAGWDFKAWFLSPHAFAVYTILGIGILYLAFAIIKEHIKRL